MKKKGPLTKLFVYFENVQISNINAVKQDDFYILLNRLFLYNTHYRVHTQKKSDTMFVQYDANEM